MRNIRLSVVALVVALILGGCAALPTSGPVRIGPDLQSGFSVDSLYYSPSPPLEGASPTDILNGFFAAHTGPQNDYAVAREYLSEGLRSTWNPNQEVLIQRVSPNVVFETEQLASVQFDLAASVDADGRYIQQPVGTTRDMEFSFVLEDGQWRLESAPDLTVLIRPVFDVIFRSYSVYFFDKQQKFLVPDLRWFPATAATGTRLVNAILRGPSAWLRPAVSSAIPSGTRLSIDAVTVEGTTALVDLTARALVATPTQRMLMKVQLDQTLSQLENVGDVAISIERSRQEISSSTESFQIQPNPSIIVLTENGAEIQAGVDINFFTSAKNFFTGFGATDLAVASKSGWIAALSPTGIWRTQFELVSSKTELVDSRENLLKPVYDNQDWLWTMSSASESSLFATPLQGERQILATSTQVGFGVRDFDISPEGTRIAFLTNSQPSKILLSSVVRDKLGKPISLGDPIEIPNEATNLVDISWRDGTTISVINSQDAFSTVSFIQVGGTTTSLSAPVGARTLVGSTATQTNYLLTDLGSLYQYRGISWVEIRDGVKALTLAH
jgi:hypothetical protein